MLPSMSMFPSMELERQPGEPSSFDPAGSTGRVAPKINSGQGSNDFQALLSGPSGQLDPLLFDPLLPDLPEDFSRLPSLPQPPEDLFMAMPSARGAPGAAMPRSGEGGQFSGAMPRSGGGGQFPGGGLTTQNAYSSAPYSSAPYPSATFPSIPFQAQGYRQGAVSQQLPYNFPQSAPPQAHPSSAQDFLTSAAGTGSGFPQLPVYQQMPFQQTPFQQASFQQASFQQPSFQDMLKGPLSPAQPGTNHSDVISRTIVSRKCSVLAAYCLVLAGCFGNVFHLCDVKEEVLLSLATAVDSR